MKATTEKAFGVKLQSVFSNPCEKWQMKKLGGIISLEYGKPLLDSQRDSSGLYPVYGANGIKDRTNEFYWNKPSIIVGRKGSAGEINITESKFWPLDVTYFIKFDEELYNLRFLYYLLKTLNLPQLAKGVKPGINRNEVYSVEVCVPESITEQHRIVSILDEAFTEIDKAKKNTEENLKKNKKLFEAKLQSIFLNPCENWQIKKLIEVCKLFNVRNTELNLPYVGMENIEAHSGKYIGSKSSQLVKSATFYFNSQCLLYGRLRPYLNKVLLPDFEGHCSTEIFPIKVNAEITKEYLFYWFILEDTAIKINKTSTGARMPRANMKEVLNFEIPLPSLPEQHRIITELDSISTETKKLEKLYRSKLTHLEELKKSILKQAFEGKL